MAISRIRQRCRAKTVILLLSMLIVLCLLNILYRTKSSAYRRTFETKSIFVQGRRSEYYVLDKDFFEFLARTNMECLIRVEPRDTWNGEASVVTKFISNDASPDELSLTKSENLTVTYMKSLPTHHADISSRKYILAYRHFEQLGKTTENLIQLTAVAKRWGRNVVEPTVKNSRFYNSEPGSLPLKTYYNLSRLNSLLQINGYSKLVKLRDFADDCNFAIRGAKTSLVHFLYSDVHSGNTKLWFGKNDKELRQIVQSTLSSGWTKCNFVNQHLSISKSLNGIKIGRQICVNPEVLRNIAEFEQKVLLDDKCVIFTEWRGFGKQRTHFHPIYWPYLTPAELKHRILPSELIEKEVARFMRGNLPTRYISVHIRTERLFLADLYRKLEYCIDHLIYLINIVRTLRGVSTVFMSSDLTDYGSDLFDRRKFFIKNTTGKYPIRRETIKDIHHNLARRLNAVSYKATSEPFTKDKGVFSLVEMNILKNGIDLVTLGSGTFHAWTVSAFKQQQNTTGRRGYTISEICRDDNSWK